MALLSGAFWQFQKDVNDEDLSGWRVFKVGDKEVPFQDLEVRLCCLDKEGVQFQMAVYRSECIGFLMYHLIADCILFVRGMHVEKVFQGKGIAPGLVASLGKPIARVIFQTRKERPPERLLGSTVPGGERRKIYEDDKLITWEFDMKNKGSF